MQSILIGAVAYAPQIVPIWDIIREYANTYFKDMRLDYVLFSNYERQVEWLKSGKIDIAWNTNVAYIRIMQMTNNTAKALLMRDTDKGFQSVYIARKGAIENLKNLGGKKFGLGSLDSAQAAIMPLYYLQHETSLKLIEGDLNTANPAQDSLMLIRYNSDVGKHGDTGRSEFDVLDAINNGVLDAGAIGSTTWARILQEGSYPNLTSFYATQEYCHCNFTALDSLDHTIASAFTTMMLSQNSQINHPKIAEMMQLEGLNAWIPCDKETLKGYDAITQAMQEQNLMQNRY